MRPVDSTRQCEGQCDRPGHVSADFFLITAVAMCVRFVVATTLQSDDITPVRTVFVLLVCCCCRSCCCRCCSFIVRSLPSNAEGWTAHGLRVAFACQVVPEQIGFVQVTELAQRHLC